MCQCGGRGAILVVTVGQLIHGFGELPQASVPLSIQGHAAGQKTEFRQV